MHLALSGLLLLLGAGGAPRPEPPAVETQPLAHPTFVLLHTNDTRGYLESCG